MNDQPRPPVTSPGPRAFTLIELIAVIVLIAILAGAAVPTLSSLGDSRGAGAARDLLRDLTYARQRAVATGTTCWVVFDEAAEEWSVLAEDPASPGRVGATVLIDAATGQPHVQRVDADGYEGVQIIDADFDSQEEIGFNWLGEPLNDSEAALAAQGSVELTGSHFIYVTAKTGHVTYVAP